MHCYNEWFRDQNLIDSVTFSTADGPDTTTDLSIQKRGKRFDYFTSGLANPQKSTDGAQELPLGTSAPIHTATTSPNNPSVYDDTAAAWKLLYVPSAPANVQTSSSAGTSGNQLYADLSNATAATILQLRQAMAIQALLELDARAGTRYNEIVYSVFGVDMIDVTYKPEFLGGGSTPVGVSQIASTYDDNTQNTKGQLGAFGTAFRS